MLEEGIALSWVPRPDIVEALLDADGFGQRLEILMARRDDILDDCRLLLAGVDSGVGQQCRAAVDAMAAGHDPPAQSHASNIIDSIVLQLLGRDGRSEAKTQARVELAQLPLRLVCENLALRPLFRAFATWHPTGFDPPPDHFSRHATAHAVGRNGVFESAHALVAVMIATSLVRQFGDDLAAQL